MLERALEIVLADDAIDAVITIVVADHGDLGRGGAGDHRTRRAGAGKPIVACSVEAAAAGTPAGAADIAGTPADAAVAEVPSPERAAAALGHVCRYAQWRRRPLLPAEEPEEPSSLR